MTGSGRAGLAALFCALAALMLLPPVSSADEGLVFDRIAHNFGRLQSIEPLEFTFSFENKSALPVAIASVVTSCGCTAAKPEKTEYQPGEKGALTVTFDPAGHSGLFESAITVEEGDGTRHILTLGADIETLDPSAVKINLPDPVISVTPQKVDLGTFKAGETAVFNVIVENTGEGDLYLVGENTPNEQGVRLSQKAIKKGKKVELTLFYKPEKAGKINDTMAIHSNDPKNPEVKIHLTGKALKAKKKK